MINAPSGSSPTPVHPTRPPVDLRCEYAQDPIGLDVPQPRFSWRIDGAEQGAAQRGYQVLVAATIADLNADRGTLWDSGHVASSQSVNVTYAGTPLVSRQACVWKVRLWDAVGQVGPYGAPARFEIGLLDPKDFIARWIGWPAGEPGKASYFRVSCQLPKAIQKARLYVSGLGYYEAYVNGRRLGDAVLEPAYTEVARRIFYTVYDVTPALTQGENIIAAIMGGGWHGTPKLLVQLEVLTDDGWQVPVATVRDAAQPPWLVASGPITANSVFDGEHYDARLERPNWTTIAYDPGAEVVRSAKWKQACQVTAPAGRLVAQAMEPIKVVKHLPAVGMREPQPGVFVFDFGQNHAGWCRLRTRGPASCTITLRYAETLGDDGRVNQDNLRGAAATDSYTLRGGDNVETWEPRFTYHGYRYVQVEGWPGTPTPGDVESCVVRSAMAFRGAFDCDDAMLNRIHTMVRWTEESNLHGLPTDCPQRDERMGWLNDLAARSEELVYNFDSCRFLSKFVGDIADSQNPQSGALTDTVPFHWGGSPADPVSVCYLLIPHLLHQHYRDVRVLRSHFAGFREWVEFLRSQSSDDRVSYSYYGDWAPPASQSAVIDGISTPLSQSTPGKLISTGYYYYAAKLLAQIAGRLDDTDNAKTYGKLAARIGKSFHAAFWNGEIGGYGSGNQACNSFALYLDLVPADLRPTVVSNLVSDVRQHDHHVTTGNLCTKYLLEVLAREGHFDTALRVATQTTYPSWGHMLANGATTLWERWEDLVGGGMNSHNHPMLGSVGSWLYRWVAGLTIAETDGPSPHFEIRVPSSMLLSRASASLDTMWGTAATAWTRDADGVSVAIDIPWNCTGTLYVGDHCRPLGSGHHSVSLLSGTIDLRPNDRTGVTIAH